jgi:hypothetical protein
MSREEFDNRLRSSFQDENLPPAEHLWVNISEKLENKAKMPYWYWVLPVLAILTVCIMWVGSSLSGNDEIAVNKTKSETTEQSNSGSVHLSATDNSVAESQKLNSNDETVSDARSESAASPEATVITNPESTKVSTSKASSFSKSDKSKTKSALSEAYFNNQVKADADEKLKLLPEQTIEMNELFRFLALSNPIIKKPSYISETFNLIVSRKEEPKDEAIQKSNSTKDRKSADMSSKRWLSAGIGPQLAFNTFAGKSDSVAWIHRHLWEKRNLLTGNGTGVQAFVNYSYKFGKKNNFFIETGLNYSLRSESILMNESSFDIITARDPDGRIIRYDKIMLEVRYYDSVNMRYDTLKYLAANSFNIAVNNRYHTLTLPFHFGSEFGITENTFLSLSLGGGITMIKSKKSEHLDMMNGEVRKSGKALAFTSSFNTKLAMYTNFNDIGQIGIYTGFQMYVNPWTVNNGQYSIRMSDAQLGITFRKPF